MTVYILYYFAECLHSSNNEVVERPLSHGEEEYKTTDRVGVGWIAALLIWVIRTDFFLLAYDFSILLKVGEGKRNGEAIMSVNNSWNT